MLKILTACPKFDKLWESNKYKMTDDCIVGNEILTVFKFQHLSCSFHHFNDNRSWHFFVFSSTKWQSFFTIACSFTFPLYTLLLSFHRFLTLYFLRKENSCYTRYKIGKWSTRTKTNNICTDKNHMIGKMYTSSLTSDLKKEEDNITIQHYILGNTVPYWYDMNLFVLKA